LSSRCAETHCLFVARALALGLASIGCLASLDSAMNFGPPPAIVVEIVQAVLLSVDDELTVQVELHWGALSAKTAPKAARRGIVTVCERLRINVPSLALRRQPLELRLAGVSPPLDLGWMPLPTNELLAGRRFRQPLPLLAPGSTQPTAYVLEAAVFLDEGGSTTPTRPFDVPMSGVSEIVSRARVTVAVQTDLSGPVVSVSVASAGVRAATAAAAVAVAAAARNDGDDDDENGGGGSGAGSTAGRESPLSGDDGASARRRAGGSFSKSGQPRSASGSFLAMRPPALVMDGVGGGKRMDPAVAEEIRAGFDFPVLAAKDAKVVARTVKGSAPLSVPVDLLAMKRSVGLWPRDEVEGLIAYGQQMKRYASQLENQNARLVLGAARDAVAELRDLGRSASLGAGGGGSSLAGSRSSSAAVTRRGAARAEEAALTFDDLDRPDFVTRIEMNRGTPLDDADRDHVTHHFGDL
jgi:hypothetical protein